MSNQAGSPSITSPIISTTTIRTRILIISDTHTASPLPSTDSTHAYRLPLPKADILLHAGDITKVGYLAEYEKMFDMLQQAPAELKLVIPGNHDITLHEEFYVWGTGKDKHVRRGGGGMEDVKRIRKLWTGEEARRAGIVYLEEGIRTFELGSGARFTVSGPGFLRDVGRIGDPEPLPVEARRICLASPTEEWFSRVIRYAFPVLHISLIELNFVYSSPWQPKFYDWAFTYPRHVDRFNPSPAVVKDKAANPVPAHPAIDILLTHGPPKGILDETDKGEKVGCDHLLRAVTRCKPRLHCFGHIHEGWGSGRINWRTKAFEQVETNEPQLFEDRCASVDISEGGGKPLKWGQETLFVNASIMDVRYNPTNAPWVVDMDLPTKQDTS